MNSLIQEGKSSTKDVSYTERLQVKQSVWWKKLFDVQRPYRWNLRRLKPGFVLDIGCGLGRNLLHLKGNGVGVDHNPSSIEYARALGLMVFVTEEFQTSEFFVPERFDSILISHVAEHMTEDDVITMIKTHSFLLRKNGKVILITPQESGYRSDKTHVQFMNFGTLRNIVGKAGLTFTKKYSFPFPRAAGKVFKYNEFICVAEKK